MPCNYNRYPDDWFTHIRPAILARAGQRCEWCGVANHSYRWNVAHTKMILVVLTIAHLDQDISNNDFSNLAALCQRCHTRHDAPHRCRHRTTNTRKRLEHAGQQCLF